MECQMHHGYETTRALDSGQIGVASQNSHQLKLEQPNFLDPLLPLSVVHCAPEGLLQSCTFNFWHDIPSLHPLTF